MQKIKTYHRQNRIQKQINGFLNLFKKDYVMRDRLKERGIEVYTPKLNKFKVGIGSVGVVGCLLTPATNWAIPFIVRWGFK